MEDFEDAYADELEMLREFDGMYMNKCSVDQLYSRLFHQTKARLPDEL